uniref:TrmH family RNA methyltransferase n=1 Tax=Novosphingobium sp. B 225 TaxID=1961849 RepID=UPI001124D8B5
ACMGVGVDLIEPLGFPWDDKRVRRAAMDYIDHVEVARHASFAAFQAQLGTARLVLFTTKAQQSPYDFAFQPDDVLLFGKESAGVPAPVAAACEVHLRLPIRRAVRSMNLAMAAGLALGEALRQTGGLPD